MATALIDANLNRTTYEYNGHDRLVKTRFPVTAIGANASSGTDYEQLTLDAEGSVTSRRLRDLDAISLSAWLSLRGLKRIPHGLTRRGEQFFPLFPVQLDGYCLQLEVEIIMSASPDRKVPLLLIALSAFCLLVLAGLVSYTGNILPSLKGASTEESLLLFFLWIVLVAVPIITILLWLFNKAKRLK